MDQKINKKVKRWRAEGVQHYWYVDNYGDIDETKEYGEKQDDFRYDTGNYFKTKAEAEEYRQRLLQEQKEKDEFEPTKTHLMKHKDEYLVESRNGRIMRLKNWTDETWGCTNEDLTDTTITGHDIIEIYKLTPVWQREEAKEMTLAEIENELGYKIKLREDKKDE